MKQCGWVVVAKSLALVCTKDQNRFCFSIWNKKKKKKKNFFPQNPQMKKNQRKEKNLKNPRNKSKTKLKTKTEHLSGH